MDNVNHNVIAEMIERVRLMKEEYNKLNKEEKEVFDAIVEDMMKEGD